MCIRDRGQPGCGKTYTLIEEVKKAIGEGVSSTRIGVVSFTKKAISEFIDRACSEFPTLTKDNFPHFKTLHATGFHGLGLDSSDVMGRQDYRALSDMLCVDFEGNNSFFSYLPMNHIAERIAIEFTSFKNGGVISFTESIDTFIKNLSEVQPSVFFGVPRIYTKFQLGILSKFSQKKLDLLLSIPFLSSLIKKKIQKSLGLSNAKVIVSGAAAMQVAQRNWFRKIGINITIGYGMTENCAITTQIPGTNFNKPHLEIAPWLIIIFSERYELNDDGSRHKNYYVNESVGIASGFLISALHIAGLSILTHTPNPMLFLNQICERPKNYKPIMILAVGYAAENATVPKAAKIKKPLREILRIF